MPSRQPPPTAASPPLHHKHHHLLAPIVGSIAAAFSLLLLLFTLCHRKLSRKRTVPSSGADSKPHRRFSYSTLRRATSSFSPSLRLGQGGFGSVFRGTLKPNFPIAVKLMDSGSLQGEREFQNELFFAGKLDSNYVVSLMGFCSEPKRRRMVLVYELLANGSLQDCLLHRKCPELMNWKKRFLIALDVARGLEYLHHFCDPPVIHGDVKPSNVLLDGDFNAKIGDFGLASEIQVNFGVQKEETLGNGIAIEENGLVIDEMENGVIASGLNFEGDMDQSVQVCCDGGELSADAATVVSPRTLAAMASPAVLFGTSFSEGNSNGISVGEINSGGDEKRGEKKKRNSEKDWWGRRSNGEYASGEGKKDYVGVAEEKEEEKKTPRRLEWFMSLDNDSDVRKYKRRPAKKWWREEYSEELTRKTKKKNKLEQDTVSDEGHSASWWSKDEEWCSANKKKRSQSRRSSRSSMDWWSDGLSGDIWGARMNSYDSASGDIPKSTGFSSTPSMRGTVCYVAPEYSIRGDLSEKCDVYSYGVLLLVLIAGRRPLQVTGSPITEVQRANLVSWARHLARAGKLLGLVDQSIHSLDNEQALLCITVALLCLQKSPASRPSMKEIVGILSGELDLPKLPTEFSPSPHSRKPRKSHRKD